MKKFLIFSMSNLGEAISDKIKDERKPIGVIEMCFVIENYLKEENKVRFLLGDSENMTLIKFNKINIKDGSNS